jgi:hypothetical protein
VIGDPAMGVMVLCDMVLFLSGCVRLSTAVMRVLPFNTASQGKSGQGS